MVAFAATAGLFLDPWQQLVLDVILRERPDGRWSARDAAYLVARQNGKGGILDALCLASLFLFEDEREILFSAHEFKTSKKAYRGMKALIEGCPHLLGRMEPWGRGRGFRNSNEDTSITTADGSVLRFMARSSNTGRGFSSQRLIVDEAQECSEETRQALTYITSAQKNPQTVFCGTVPGPLNNGEVFEALRDRGRSGTDRTLAWLEWTPEEGADPMGDEAAIASNPGMPYRITSETIEAERAAAITPASLAGYCRERLSMWGAVGAAVRWSVMSESDWLACADEAPADGSWLCDPVTFAVDVLPDRSVSTIAAAGFLTVGGVGVEVVDERPDAGWVVDRCIELDAKHSPKGWLIDPRSGAGPFIRPMRDAGLSVTECSTADLVKACGEFFDDVKAHRVRHTGGAVLSEAAAAGTRRKVGASWVWAERGPLPAVSLARWGHAQILQDVSESCW